MQQTRKKHRGGCVLSVLIIGIAGVLSALEIYHDMVCNIVSKDGEKHGYYIYPDTPMDSLMGWIENDYDVASKGSITRYRHYTKKTAINPGYYELGSRVSNRSLIGRLHQGRQTPVQLRFTNQIRTVSQLAARMGKVLMLDSADIAERLESASYMQQFGLNKATAICLFIPNTYEVYWTISPDDLFARMYKEYNRFWTDERKQLAQALHLTPTEVSTLASIVESETHNTKEHPVIASLYLNRLRKGMPLQACPTVIFATGDFSLQRVNKSHLQIASPYNTYKNLGLPPGPIRCANGATMDAVLRAPKTNYLYMCANADWSGTHVFSATYSDHERAAVAYRRELNRRHIK
ncbi:MAG: endolytic transglycosylase MltG [Paludibacteraceae bacterium]|nr:endolytic transglycosylase MltG [Paludibacteraceae bacterium]